MVIFIFNGIKSIIKFILDVIRLLFEIMICKIIFI